MSDDDNDKRDEQEAEAERARESAMALLPLDQRRVALLEGDEVLAVKAEDDEIYLPLRPICTTLGLYYRAQRRRIARDPVLEAGMRDIRIETPGGPQATPCLLLKHVPYWLSTVEVARIKPELQEKLTIYRRWVIEKVFEAFQRETGIGMSTAPAVRDGETASLVQIRDMALAIAAFAEQQLAFFEQQQIQDRRLGVLEQGQEQLTARLDRAAGVVGGLVRSVKALEQRLSPGAVITEEQAAEVSNMVKAVAETLTRQDVAAGAAPRNWYQSIWGEMYRRYNVAGYRSLPAARYGDVLTWLADFRAAASPPSRSEEE